jgi:hypothetical protein
MRTLLVELRPEALTQLSLSDLLRQLGEATAGRTRLQVTTRVEGSIRKLPAAVHVALYRLAQEALEHLVEPIVRLEIPQSQGTCDTAPPQYSQTWTSGAAFIRQNTCSPRGSGHFEFKVSVLSSQATTAGTPSHRTS